VDQSGALGDCPIWPNTEPGKGREGIHAPRKKAYERLVLLIAAGWLAVVGATLAYMLYNDKTGWHFSSVAYSPSHSSPLPIPWPSCGGIGIELWHQNSNYPADRCKFESRS